MRGPQMWFFIVFICGFWLFLKNGFDHLFGFPWNFPIWLFDCVFWPGARSGAGPSRPWKIIKNQDLGMWAWNSEMYDVFAYPSPSIPTHFQPIIETLPHPVGIDLKPRLWLYSGPLVADCLEQISGTSSPCFWFARYTAGAPEISAYKQRARGTIAKEHIC